MATPHRRGEDLVITTPPPRIPSASEVDARGIPLIFRTSIKTLMAQSSPAPSPRSMTARSMSQDTVATALYDEHELDGTAPTIDSTGFPVFGLRASADCVEQSDLASHCAADQFDLASHCASADCVPKSGIASRGSDLKSSTDDDEDASEDAILDPRPCARKARVFASRNADKAVKKRPAAKASPSKKTKKAAAPPSKKADTDPDMNEVLSRPRISGPTNEPTPRTELVAFYKNVDGKDRRLHVFTLNGKSSGPMLHSVVQ